MKNREIYPILYDYCRWSQVEKVRICLAEHKDIDLIMNGIYEEEDFFRIALSKGSLNILNVLLDFFEQTKLRSTSDLVGGDFIEAERANAYWRHKLSNALEDALEIVDAIDESIVSQEMRELLSKYIIEVVDSENGDDAVELEHDLYNTDVSHEQRESSETTFDQHVLEYNIPLVGENYQYPLSQNEK